MSNYLTNEQRLKYNTQVVEILQTLVKQYPSMRFSQILATWDFVQRDMQGHWKEEYYVEPNVVLARVIEALGKVG